MGAGRLIERPAFVGNPGWSLLWGVVSTTERNRDGGDERLERGVMIALLVALTAAVLVGYIIYEPRATFDTLWSLNWSRDIWQGGLPNFEAYRVPTQHPLLLAIGLLVQPAGDYAASLMVAWSLIGYIALMIAVYRLGVMAAGVLGGLVAFGLLVTRLQVAYMAGVGFLDPPYAALVCWAAVLEARNTRRGWPVWVLLTMAGLLRPEAWLLAGLYALWIGYPLGWWGRIRALCYAAIAPLIWLLVDFIVTGNPLFSMTMTSSAAEALGRSRPLDTLPYYTLYWTNAMLKLPVSIIAALGVIAAIQQRRKQLILPAIMVATTWFSYLVIASGGLANVWRYVLVAAIGLIVFAAYAISGWTTLERGSKLRRWWAVGAVLLVAAGVGWTATHLNLKRVDEEVQRRRALHDQFVEVMTAPAVLRARRCGPVSVPTQKLLAEAKWDFELDTGDPFPGSNPSVPEIFARSDKTIPVQTEGVAIVINPGYEVRPDMNINEYAVDNGWAEVQIPPPGFEYLAGTEFFLAYGRCAPGRP